VSAPADAPTIVVPASVRDELLSHAREGAPEEVCGILAGTNGDGETAGSGARWPSRCVETHHPAANVAGTPRTRYEIDPREQLELMERIEDAGREVVGFYHSHPQGPAEPSATDAAQATWPGRSYVIASLDGGDAAASVGSWRWTGERFIAEEVRIEES
jgi:proteasome lid subunit RPN8/RPN11